MNENGNHAAPTPLRLSTERAALPELTAEERADVLDAARRAKAGDHWQAVIYARAGALRVVRLKRV